MTDLDELQRIAKDLAIPDNTDPRARVVQEACEEIERFRNIETMLNEGELERYPENGDGRRVWARHASVWLRPGDRIVVIGDA